MKYSLITLLMTLVVMCTTPVLAESLSVGGGQNRGHSYTEHCGIEGGYSGYLSYQKDKDYNWLLGLSYGVTVFGTQFDRKHNGNGNHYKETSEHLLAPSLDVTLYLNLKRVRPFARVGAGYEFSTDEGAEPMIAPAFGLEVVLTDNLSIELMSTKLITEERRHGIETIGIKWRF